MREKLNRRKFIGNVSIAIIGSAAFGACVSNNKNDGDKLAGKKVEPHSEYKILKNQTSSC